MPQLNNEFFVSQIFCLAVFFTFLFVFLWRVSLPRIATVLEKRQNKIDESLSSAKELQEQAMEIEAAKVIGAGLAVIGVIGSGIGIGNIFSSFIQAVGRNPAARGEVFTMTMLGFALVEAIALFALVIALVILFG
jgi:F0F1-type ATP synthase membrane subunit c/vacuolar-type H+-ATPase subunit K